jgi:hypothetical protein
MIQHFISKNISLNLDLKGFNESLEISHEIFIHEQESII